MQGFGGNKAFDDNIAITTSCNNLKDNDYVVFKGKDMTWIELKSGKLKHWNFKRDQIQVDLSRRT